MIVQFQAGHDGSPMCIIDRKPSFPPRGSEVKVGDEWEVSVSGQNPKKTVNFLKLIRFISSEQSRRKALMDERAARDAEYAAARKIHYEKVDAATIWLNELQWRNSEALDILKNGVMPGYYFGRNPDDSVDDFKEYQLAKLPRIEADLLHMESEPIAHQWSIEGRWQGTGEALLKAIEKGEVGLYEEIDPLINGGFNKSKRVFASKIFPSIKEMGIEVCSECKCRYPSGTFTQTEFGKNGRGWRCPNGHIAIVTQPDWKSSAFVYQEVLSAHRSAQENARWEKKNS